jgi:hypothetical protein
VNEKVFNKLNDIELEKVGRKIKDSYPEMIFRSFPDSQILREDKAISHLEKATGLDHNTIIHSVKELVSQNKLIVAKDSKYRTYFSKLKI